MDNQDNGISLGQLFSVIKKSLLRGLIYVLVSVIMLTAILVLVKTFTSTKVYNSTISFSTTDESTLEQLKAYKANAVNKALQSDEKELNLSVDVVKNLSVSAVIPEENEKDSSFIPTSFIVSLKSSSDLQLSSGEYKSLVDNIAKEYVNQFATSSMPELSATINADSQLDLGAEYIQVAYYLSDIIDNYLSNLNSFADSNPAAKSFSSENGKNINSVIADLDLAKKTVDTLKYTIIANKYGVGNLNSYVAAISAEVTAEVAGCEELCTKLTAIMNTYKSTVEEITKDNNGNNVYYFNDSAFVSLTEQSLSAANQLKAAKIKQAEVDNFITLVGGAVGTPNADVVTSLKSSATMLSSVIDSYDTLANEFNGNKTSISPASISKPASSASESFINVKIVLIADVAVALIAYIVAFSQTFAIMKKKGELN